MSSAEETASVTLYGATLRQARAVCAAEDWSLGDLCHEATLYYLERHAMSAAVESYLRASGTNPRETQAVMAAMHACDGVATFAARLVAGDE